MSNEADPMLPIPFSPSMSLAVRERRKTVTRRVMRPQPAHGIGRYTQDGTPGEVDWVLLDEDGDPTDSALRCPYGRPGTLLYVRERMRVVELRGLHIRVRYEADGAESDWIEYPARLSSTPVVGQCLAYGGFREASRTTLRVTGVRVERLQGISEEEARAEGVTPFEGIGPDQRIDDTPRTQGTHPYTIAFASLWDDLNFPRGYGWDVNPWVWCVSFELVEAQ